MLVLRILLAEAAHQTLYVAALSFGEPGGGQADDIRIALVAQGTQAFDHVFIGVHHRGDVIHGGGLQRDGLAEVAHEENLAEGGAALRAVHHRDGPAQA